MAQRRHIGGFWSYVHHDDEHEGGRIKRLREHLERSIRFFSGKLKFEIFLDQNDIGWGQDWAERIANSVDDALLLFPVVTPSYFASAACRKEAIAFRRRQETLGRNDLVLPIYYLTAAHLENADHGTPEEAEVATLLRTHQYEDWRALRGTPETDPAYLKAVERLAQRAVEALDRASPANTSTSPPQEPASRRRANQSGIEPAASAENAQSIQTEGGAADQAEPGLIITFTVNPMPGRAQFTTISEAIARAPGGARILIAPGHYRENLVVDKPLELIGDGPCEDIIVETDESEVLVFDTNIGVARNLTLRQSAKHKKHFCLLIKQGRLELEDCDLSSTSLSCLAVRNNADPRVRRNRIHGGNQSGLFIYDNGVGTYEENEIFGNTLAGVAVRSAADPVVRRNRIFDGRGAGIQIYEQGRGIFEENEIFGNSSTGIQVVTAAEPIVRRNRIYDGRRGGLFVADKGRGTFEENEIFGNNLAGVQVITEADPVIRRNRIYGGRQGGIMIMEKGRGTFEDNDIFGNTLSGIEVATEAEPVVRRNRIHDGQEGGIYVHEKGGGIFEDNEIFGNTYSAFEAKTGAKPIVRRNRIYDGKQSGIYVHSQGRGTFEANEIRGNRFYGISVEKRGKPIARANSITGNLLAGVRVLKTGAGIFEDNELNGNGKPWEINPLAEARVKRTGNRET